MRAIASYYQRYILAHPLITLLIFLLILAAASVHLNRFRLDASAESLVLENDQALAQYRTMNRHFATSDNFLVVTFKPDQPLFSPGGIQTLRNLRNELADLDAVSSTNSILNVPLLYSPDLTLDNVDSELRSLDDDNVPLDTARQSLLNNPLYPNLLLSEDAGTTAIQVNLPTPDRYFDLLNERNKLRAAARSGTLTDAQQQRLSQVSDEFISLKETLNDRQKHTIGQVRGILDKYRDKGVLHLGGVPMIVADMIRFIKSDLSTFGIGVITFLLITLALIFRQWRWVAAPLACCVFTVWLVIGYLGWVEWPVTVISSNFVALLLIMTLSMTIHLMVRYRELQREQPAAPAQTIMRDTVVSMLKPCFYMAITTIVAFGSLTLSGIRPVIDFGWIMTLGLSLAFLITFVIFPALLSLIPPRPDHRSGDDNSAFTGFFARVTERFGGTILVVSLLIAGASLAGMTRLSVENSFIDYFKSSTEISQGMLTIDHKLGGTTPLDVVITDPDTGKQAAGSGDAGQCDPFVSDCNQHASSSSCDPFVDDCGDATSHRDTWFTYQKMARLKKVQAYLDSLPETGKVLSIATTLELFAQINQGQPLNAVQLAFVPKAIPDDLRDTLLSPYISEKHDEARFSMRLIDSSPDLKRNELINRIHDHLVNDMGFKDKNVTLTGMTVMYDNMLQSLFDSQIKTLGLVFLAILVMFLVLFRSLKLALIGIAPNLLAAASVLGLMGWLSIPLDLMTITVAAITVGIAVDDTIHYIHRFQVEFAKDGNYLATMHRCHGSIGRAMFYTSLTIVVGFSILVLSNFMPTIYFGLFTGFAMLMALLGALTLLPRLIVMVKPLGPETAPATGRP